MGVIKNEEIDWLKLQSLNLRLYKRLLRNNFPLEIIEISAVIEFELSWIWREKEKKSGKKE
jgi:hypothetical protein